MKKWAMELIRAFAKQAEQEALAIDSRKESEAAMAAAVAIVARYSHIATRVVEKEGLYEYGEVAPVWGATILVRASAL